MRGQLSGSPVLPDFFSDLHILTENFKIIFLRIFAPLPLHVMLFM